MRWLIIQWIRYRGRSPPLWTPGRPCCRAGPAKAHHALNHLDAQPLHGEPLGLERAERVELFRLQNGLRAFKHTLPEILLEVHDLVHLLLGEHGAGSVGLPPDQNC